MKRVGTRNIFFFTWPKGIVDRRKKVLPKFFAAKKACKSAYFSRAEPDKLFIDGKLFSA